MSNLIETLLSIKHSRNNFIERPELIQGYTEDEIKQIEQRYNLSIHGQFKEFLMTMGRCSGGLVTGSEIYIVVVQNIPLEKKQELIYIMIKIVNTLLIL